MPTHYVRSVGRVRPLTRRAGLAAGPACESLESRQLMSTFAYGDLAALVTAPDASRLSDDFYGPVAVLGDLDGDGTTDLLVGNQYASVASGSGATTVFNGAAVISGATGETIRLHRPADSVRFGWSVAALGDVNGDDIPDYGIGTGGTEGDPVAYAFSGATGEVLHTFGTHIPGEPGVAGTTIAGAGDINGDGRGDILVAFLQDNRTVLYSGADGAELRQFAGEGGWGLAAGKDLDGDDTPDLIIGSLGFVTAYSGASGMQLWRVNQPQAYSIPSVSIDNSTDFNGDGRADALITTTDFYFESDMGVVSTRARVYSGADGALLLFLRGPGTRGFAGAAAAIADVNGDGTPDVAATAIGGGQFGTGPGNGLFLYSGADATLIATMTDDGPATLTDGVSPLRMAIMGPAATADLDGDGRAELITAAVLDVHGASQTATSIRLISFGGRTLGAPVFEHAEPDAQGNLAAWGHLGDAAFIYNRGRTTFITDLGFAADDRILSFCGFGTEVLLVIAPGGDHTNPIAWFAASDLTGGKSYIIKNAARTTGPAGTYTIDGVADADGGQVLVQMTRDGTTPTAFVFERVPSANPSDPGRLAYRFDGRPTAIYAERVVGLSNDDPGLGVLWNFGTPIQIPGFRPVGLYLPAVPSMTQPVVVVGVAQRDGDAFGKPYRYSSVTGDFMAIPLIEGGTDWEPVSVDASGGVAGTFRRASGVLSIFLTRFVPLSAPQEVTEDVLAGTLIDAPFGLAGSTPHVIGIGAPAQAGATFDVYFTFDRSPIGAAGSGVLSDIAGPGPFLSPAGAAFSLSEDGTVLVTLNAAGEVLVYQRLDLAGGGESWQRRDFAFSQEGAAGGPVYTTAHFGPVITWTQPGWENPFIALATDTGLLLFEPIVDTTGGSGPPMPPYIERYEVRDLTALTPGAEPITRGLTTFLPASGLRLVAGLTADGDLAMYGMTAPMVYFPGSVSAWAYANLFDQVLRPAGLTEPRFDVVAHGDLVSYVTPWGGLNIAGVDADTGDVVVFWHAPGLSGWRYSNLDDSLADPSAANGVSHLSVYLTPWGGINIVGGSDLGVYWWAPGMGSTWSFHVLTDIAAGAKVRADTVTAYVTPWGGLNVAGLDQEGRLWVYWWTPTVYWTAETIDAALPEADAAVARTGRLRSAVSTDGRIDIYARGLLGDPLRYEWSPQAAWTLKNLNVL